MNQYFKDVIDVLEYSLNSIDENMYEQLLHECVITLRNKNKIIVSGLGKNTPVCEKFVGTMVSLGLNACYLNTSSAIHGDIGLVHEGDLVILLTKSGETSESVYLYEVLKERKCAIWLISFNINGLLSHKIKNRIIIDMEHEGDKWNIVPCNSTTLNLIVLQGLAMQIVEKLQVPLDEFKKNHPGGHIGDVLKNEKRREEA